MAKYVENLLEAFKTGVQVPTSPPKTKRAYLAPFFVLVKEGWGLADGENLLANLSERTKQWTPTVYRVGRTGESPILRTKKELCQ